jgi:PIG-P
MPPYSALARQNSSSSSSSPSPSPTSPFPTTADVRTGDRLAKQSDVTVGSEAVPPETEYFGFALFVGSRFVLLVYIVWAFAPRSLLHALNIYYYPSRWWALAVPSFVLVLMIYIYVALASFNVEMLTKPLDSLEIISDIHAKVVPDELVEGLLYRPSDGVWDLPISDVSQILYGERQESSDDEDM